MSIEWLLMKTTDIEAQRKVLEKAYKQGRLSDKVYNKKLKELYKAAVNSQGQSRLRDESILPAKLQDQQFEIDLRCDCGYEGAVTCGEMDVKLVGKDKKGFVHFECPSCKRHLQYDCSNGTVKTAKGLLDVLLRRFS